MKRILLIAVSVVFLTQCSNASRHDASTATAQQSNASRALGTNAQSQDKSQTIRWEKQTITFNVPSNWTKDANLSDREDKLGDHTTDEQVWRGGEQQRFEVLVDTSDSDFPVSIEEMLAADYKSSASGNPAYQDVRYLEINGVKGVYWRQGDDLNINWLTYRHYKDKAQMVGVHLNGSKNDLELLTKILMSIKLENQ